MQRHSTTKRKRRPKSKKRVDWTAETLRKLKEHEQADDTCCFAYTPNFEEECLKVPVEVRTKFFEALDKVDALTKETQEGYRVIPQEDTNG